MPIYLVMQDFVGPQTETSDVRNGNPGTFVEYRTYHGNTQPILLMVYLHKGHDTMTGLPIMVLWMPSASSVIGGWNNKIKPPSLWLVVEQESPHALMQRLKVRSDSYGSETRVEAN